MSKNLSLKLRDEIFIEMETTTRRLKRARNAYINEAVAHFNRLHRRRLLGAQLARASAAVMDESMRVLKEFEAIDEVPE
jgi:predicted transcriptional regulator